MKTTERILWIAFIVAVILRIIAKIPFPIPLFIGLALAFFYFAGTYLLFKKSIPNQSKKITPLISGCIFAFSTIAIIFKLMQWPGSTANILLALIGTIILITTSLLKLKKVDNEDLSAFFKMILQRSVIFLIILVLLLGFTFFTPFEVQKSILPLTN